MQVSSATLLEITRQASNHTLSSAHAVFNAAALQPRGLHAARNILPRLPRSRPNATLSPKQLQLLHCCCRSDLAILSWRLGGCWSIRDPDFRFRLVFCACFLQQQPLIAFSTACYIVTYASSPINIALNLLWPVVRKPVNAPPRPATRWRPCRRPTKRLRQADKGSASQPITIDGGTQPSSAR
jgi:hypothetical protein